MLAKLDLRLADLDVAMVLPGNEAVRGAVEAGAGAAVLSRSVVVSGLASGRLVEVLHDFPTRPFHLLRHKQRYRSRAGDTFIDMCGSFSKGCA
jgi:DNA-binding transcriptional LysR family regulator